MRAQLISHAARPPNSWLTFGARSRTMIHESNIRAELDKMVKSGRAVKTITVRYDGHPDKPGGAMGEKRRSYRLTSAGRGYAKQCKIEIFALLGLGLEDL